jgi:hypothetical protein
MTTSDTNGSLTDDTPLIIEWRQTYTEECRAAFTMRGIRPLLAGSYPPDTDPVDLIGETYGPLDTILASLHPRETYGFCGSREVTTIKRARGARPLRLDHQPGSPGRFTLDESRAAEWISRGVTQTDDGPMDGEDGYGGGLPAVSTGWRPWQDDGCATSDLLSLAQAAGVITGPPGAAIEYEQVTDQDGGGYRWLVFLGGEGPRLILADAFSDSWTKAAGAEAALEMLRDAATAGNELLGDLSRYKTASVRPAPPAEVWVLEYRHKHGTHLTAHVTEQAARLAVAQIARDFWQDVAVPGMPADLDALDDDEATRIYFEACGDQESYDIRRLDVTGRPAPAPGCEVAQRFTLASGAAEWIARAVTEYEEGASNPDPALPDLGAGYCAAWDEDGSDTINLISAALAARIIADTRQAPDAPGRPDLVWEYLADGDGGGYRWLLYDGVRGPILASPIEGMAHLGGGLDVTGAESALEVLRTAVEAGNMLDRQRTTLSATPAPPDGLRADLDTFAATLPRGEWGATELGLLADFLTDHGYDIDD